MKTKLPESITTVEQAKEFLTELHRNGEQFHPEDDAHDIHWNSGIKPTEAQRDRLNKLMADIYRLPGNDMSPQNMVFDPCGFLLKLSGHVMEQDYPHLDFTPEPAKGEWDAVEVDACIEEDGSVTSGVNDEEAQFFSVYLHQVTGGVQCVADLPTRKLAEQLAELITNAAKSYKP